jgi:hypothetical protein
MYISYIYSMYCLFLSGPSVFQASKRPERDFEIYG